MVLAGFQGIGVYWNGKIISYHGDIREDSFGQWTGKKKPDGTWEYGPLILDPRGVK
jgi:hypothetical protein